MGRPKSLHFITLGPAIPVVPMTAFTKFKDAGITPEMFRNAWEIVGPSVERNMGAHVELWQIITAAYLEGLAHGAALTKEVYKDEEAS